MATRIPAGNGRAGGTLKLGASEVHRLGYGAMRLCAGYAWGPPPDRAAAHRVLRRAVELGVDFMDTADSYGPEVNETLIAEALHPYPKHVVIATKGGYVRGPHGGWNPDGRPEHLRRALEGSLKRLKLDCVELYQLHTPDPKVPFIESVEALAACRRAGMIRQLGLSNVSAKQLREAHVIAPIASVQNAYNLEDRSSQAVLEECERLGIAFIPWYPLGAGASVRSGRLKTIAARHGATPAQVALAWLLARSPVMLPIPGTSSIAHLEENVQAAQLQLNAEDRAALD
jgi:aryl-alcohol dehydrogenase-like predicted oxidoreductase